MFNELWSELRFRLRAIVNRGEMERELDDELRFHIEREAEKYVREGLPHDEALRRARLAFGGTTRIKDDARDERGVTFFEHVTQDVRYALRGLRKQPLFAAVVVATLGLGVGVNTAMFGVLDRVLLRPPRYLVDDRTAHRIYVTSNGGDGARRFDNALQFARYRDFERWSQAFSEFAAFAHRSVAVGEGTETRESLVGVVTASYFNFFNAKPVVGRFFSAADDAAPEGSPVVVLGHGYWQSAYGGRSDAVGSTLRVGRVIYTIIGVAPEGFEGVSDTRVPVAFVPMTTFAYSIRKAYDRTYTWRWLEILARRKPGVSLEAANADLTNAYQRSWNAERALSPSTPEVSVARPAAVAAPIQVARGPAAGPESRVLVWVSGVAFVVLLIACANVANLLLARSVRRRREIALRRAIGGTRGRLFQQLLTETLVLALLGTVAGLIAAQLTTGALLKLFVNSSVDLPVLTDVRTLGAALVLTLVTAALAGVLPAMHSGRDDLAGSLRAGSRDGTYRQSGVRVGLLLLQTSLSAVLLVGAGLFVRSLEHVRGIRLGYDVDPLVYVESNMRGMALNPDQGRALSDRLLTEARALPGVIEAAQVISVPFWTSEGQPFYVAGVDSVSKLGNFTLQAGSSSYFSTLGTRILRGRGILAEDRAESPRVVVVSEGMGKALWKGEDPIGKCIRISSDTMPCTTVVGVAEDMKVWSLTSTDQFTYYLPMEQYAMTTGHEPAIALMVRVRGRPDQQTDMIRGRLQTIMPGASYLNVLSMREILDPQMRSWNSGARMFLMFGALALALATIGLYAVIAFAVAQRRQELGVRIALGANIGSVVRLVVGEGLRVTVGGLVIGAVIAFAAGRSLESMLYRVSPRDPIVFAVVAVTLLVVGILASAIPAFRASRVDPSVAIRGE